MGAGCEKGLGPGGIKVLGGVSVSTKKKEVWLMLASPRTRFTLQGYNTDSSVWVAYGAAVLGW